MTDQQLMQQIKTQYGALIDAAVVGTPFSGNSAFLAALVANESGGNPAATRFEPAVCGRLVQTLNGTTQSFGAITWTQLANYLNPNGTSGLTMIVDRLYSISSSWGLTQIMGYQALAGGYSIDDLEHPAAHLLRAVTMLENFQKQFKLASNDAEGFFRCWNSGSPTGKTFDALYVPNGLNRMAIYQALP